MIQRIRGARRLGNISCVFASGPGGFSAEVGHPTPANLPDALDHSYFTCNGRLAPRYGHEPAAALAEAAKSSRAVHLLDCDSVALT